MQRDTADEHLMTLHTGKGNAAPALSRETRIERLEEQLACEIVGGIVSAERHGKLKPLDLVPAHV